MIYSGADLIRTSGQQADRLQKLRVADDVQPVAGPAPSQAPQKEDMQDALMRFARFVKGEARHKKGPPKKASPKIPVGYMSQIHLFDETPKNGESLDIYI